MKNLLGSFKKRSTKTVGFELLSENEMLQVRGGSDRTKPSSRPRDIFDTEEL